MKTAYVIIANLCFIIGYAQEKNSNRKDFKPAENSKALIAQMKTDSLNGIKSISTKKIFAISQDTGSANTIIDTTTNSKKVPLNTSKK